MLELKLNVVKNFAKSGLTVAPATGWSKPEDDFVWNDGEMSTIWFRCDVNSELVRLALVVAPNVTADDEGQRVQLFLNGILVGYKRLISRGFQGVDFVFPSNVLRPLNKLDFIFLDAARPASNGGTDQRLLAAAFESIQIVAA